MTVFGVYWPAEWVVTVWTVVGVLTTRKIRYALAWRRECRAQEARRYAERADYEQWHAQFGDERIATFGRFQP